MQDTQTVEKPLTQFKSKAELHQSTNSEIEAPGEWSVAQIEALFALPFNELMLKAQETHKLAGNSRSLQDSRPF